MAPKDDLQQRLLLQKIHDEQVRARVGEEEWKRIEKRRNKLALFGCLTFLGLGAALGLFIIYCFKYR